MQRYQVSISAEKLPRGGWGIPDPYASVMITGGSREGEVLGKSEPVFKTTQPKFAKTFFVEAHSGMYLPFRVDIFNQKNGKQLGSASFEATEVNTAKGSMQIVTASTGARICASVRPSVRGDSSGTASLWLRGLDMKNVEPGILGLGRSDPYFEISKKDADHASGIVQWTVVYRSKHINNHLNPYWDSFQLSLEELCYCDLNWPLKITVWDFQENGTHRVIGDVETTMNLLSRTIAVKGNADREKALEIQGESRSKSGEMKTRGFVVVLKADVVLDEEADPAIFTI